MMNQQQHAPANPPRPPADCRSEMIRSLLREGRELKSTIEKLETEGRALVEIQNENNALRARMNEWVELSIKVNRLEERISSMIVTEREQLKMALTEREARITEREPKSSKSKIWSEMVRWKSAQEQATRGRAVEIQTLMEKIQRSEAEAAQRTAEDAQTTAEAAQVQVGDQGSAESLTDIARKIEEALQSINDSNKAMIEELADATKKCV